MKHILHTLIALTVSLAAFTAPVNTLIQNNGNWNSANVWSLNRVPANNDTIVIPAGLTLIISSNISVNNLYITVSGKIKLSNGKLNLDKFSDIYVLIGGTITGSGNNDKIKIGNNEVFRGSEPAVIGPAFADITTGNSFESFAVLPVRFVTFTAKKVAGGTELKWITSEEINNSHFEIEFSNNGTTWLIAGEIKASLNPSATNKYLFLHTNTAAPVSYYRIRQVDKSGHSSYSLVQVVQSIVNAPEVVVFASSNHEIAVKLTGVQGYVTIKVFNQSGRLIAQRDQRNNTDLKINTGSVATDIYVVQVIHEGKLVSAKKLML